MAVIDPDGLFGGNRLRRCSDASRLWWPYFFLAANGFGRLELNYSVLVNRIAGGFHRPPIEEEVYGYFIEYRDNYLAFLYEASGQIWAQFYCKPGYLPRWKTAADKKSPAPPEKQYQAWLNSYKTDIKTLPKVSEVFGSLPKSFGNPSEILPHGVGVGVGVGVGEGEGKGTSAPPTPSPPLKSSEDFGSPRKLAADFGNIPKLSADFGSPLESSDGFELWAEDRYRLHPRKGHKLRSLQALAHIPQLEVAEIQVEFERVHDLWIASEGWKWKAGAAAPYLDDWIRDEGYRYEPETVGATGETSEERTARLQREMEAEDAACKPH
jgi:hypothetical protein